MNLKYNVAVQEVVFGHYLGLTILFFNLIYQLYFFLYTYIYAILVLNKSILSLGEFRSRMCSTLLE